MEVVFSLGDRNEVNGQANVGDQGIRDQFTDFLLGGVEDDGEVKVAVGAVVAAGAGAEGDDLEGIAGGDDATDGLVDLFAGDGPIERDGFVGHGRLA